MRVPQNKKHDASNGTFAGSGSFQRCRHPTPAACLPVCQCVGGPLRPVKICRHEMARSARKDWIDARYVVGILRAVSVYATQMAGNYLIRYAQERLIATLPALHLRLATTPRTHSFAQAGEYPDLPVLRFSHRRGNTSVRPEKSRRNNRIISEALDSTVMEAWSAFRSLPSAWIPCNRCSLLTRSPRSASSSVSRARMDPR